MLTEMKQASYGEAAMVAGDVYKLLLENERVRVFDVQFQPGQTIFMGAGPHAAENIGKTAGHALVVELK